MPDVLSENPVTLTTYETFVATERKSEAPINDDNWIGQRALLLDNEAKEFMGQHGPGGILLAPRQYLDRFSGFTEPYPELVHDMADELSDLLWYSFDVAHHYGRDAGALTAAALEAHAGEGINRAQTFQEMQDNVMSHAADITFSYDTNDGLERKAEVALTDSPLQAFAIAHLRLITALQASSPEPVTETLHVTHEEIELDKALGDYINVLVYIAKDRLNLAIEDVARYNVFKLRHRGEFGKQAGNLFLKFSETQVVQDT